MNAFLDIKIYRKFRIYRE